MEIFRPSIELLPSYAQALRQGWTGDQGDADRSLQELEVIELQPEELVASKDDPLALGGDVILDDGTNVPRLPGYYRWMWDGEVVGSINFRWVYGTTDLPDYCLGHIGYSVAPWQQKKGYATSALRQVLPSAWELDMPFVELTTNTNNLASQEVIKNNGGVLVEEFVTLPAHGQFPAYRWRIFRP